ncbi:hypothetical protein JCM21714_1641 [Gracilibacillus boraciitolerans JCM 21714]|uniref:Prepilin-type N-terminal cleavage/methylation domain-containing protein n=1 Tax=Gracilibacillus boraciitolerans JCM 21714 TaxID=1298598 RepID=W4VII7_9BACI|nr:type II secretion system protein [Gracilibacillus boraciitolerans]GAE92633.1 hypothetical protein JCM21714_1641 [Gracilibacillus boraciitolerans JCM 21714]
MEKEWFKNEKGLTLIELLASLVILSIIVAAFLTFFINSARTTNVAKEVVDATYVTQQELESMYHLLTEKNFEQFIADMKKQSVQSQTTTTTNRFTIRKKSYRLEITIEPAQDQQNNFISNLYHILIKTYDHEDRQKAQMETRFLIDGGSR